MGYLPWEDFPSLFNKRRGAGLLVMCGETSAPVSSFGSWPHPLPSTGSPSTPSLAIGHTGFPFPRRPFKGSNLHSQCTFCCASAAPLTHSSDLCSRAGASGKPRPQADMGLFDGIPQSSVTSSGVPLAHSKSYLLIPASGLVPGMQTSPRNCAG